MKIEKDTLVSHYKILSEIGKGGMGEVYLAEDTRLDRKVAIKFLNDEFSSDTDKLNRFVQEAKAASALNHPNILTIHEIGEIDGTNYIATEFIDGKDLSHFISEDKVSLESALDISIQIVSALQTAHEAGIVHRDIKPDNAMVRKDGIVKLLDFGLAKLSEKPSVENPDLEAATIARIDTVPGVVMGTPNYMSPEQTRGKDIDHQTDIFSFGVVLYEMLTRKLPFAGDTTSDIIASILMKEPKPIEAFNEAVPDDLKQIVAKSLKKDKGERYQNASDLLEDLKALKKRVELDEELERTILPKGQETKVFHATTAGDVQNTTINDSKISVSLEKSSINKLLLAVTGVLLISAIGFGYWYFSSGYQINSIAVMPFVNESGNEEVEYLSDGMTETLISSLTKIPNLSVMARSSVFYYKGKNTNPRQIGEELNVEAILLGRVTQRGEDLKISLELVDTKTLAAIWSETYDRKMNDLVTLQSEIARNVSDKLRLKLTASEQEKAAGSGTANSEAQQLYLKGLFHFNKRTGRNGDQEMEKGVDFFKQAIGKDPNYALAFAGLAASYSLMPWYGDYDPRESLPKAKEAAQKSLELDPGLSEAHAVLGNILSYSYDWEGGERSYLKAIELNPKYANAHGWYADYFATKGLYDKALREYDKALEIDPLDHVAGFDKVRTLVFAERYDEAVSLTKKLIELFPENGLGPLYLDASYKGKGMEREAMEQWWIAMDKFGYSEAMIQEFKDVYKESGLDGLYRKQIEILLARVKTKLEQNKNAFVRYARIYEIYADLKDKEKTLEYMNKAYQQREMDLINLKRGRRYDFLKDEPEFQELLKKIGYPE